MPANIIKRPVSKKAAFAIRRTPIDIAPREFRIPFDFIARIFPAFSAVLCFAFVSGAFLGFFSFSFVFDKFTRV